LQCAGSPRPSLGLLSASFLPQAQYSFQGAGPGAQAWDGGPPWKLLWAVNSGSLSLLPTAPVYRPELLELQLDQTLRRSLRELRQVHVEGGTVVLPQLCRWYALWFERQGQGRGQRQSVGARRSLALSLGLAGGGGAGVAGERRAAGMDALVQLMPFCADETKLQLADLLNRTNRPGRRAPGALAVRYAPYLYQCRALLPWTCDSDSNSGGEGEIQGEGEGDSSRGEASASDSHGSAAQSGAQTQGQAQA
jgi:hypothetical protein